MESAVEEEVVAGGGQAGHPADGPALPRRAVFPVGELRQVAFGEVEDALLDRTKMYIRCPAVAGHPLPVGHRFKGRDGPVFTRHPLPRAKGQPARVAGPGDSTDAEALRSRPRCPASGPTHRDRDFAESTGQLLQVRGEKRR